eukprot:scaffold30791_cov78-Phaeocystis_antarctica.AAC.1
MTKSRLARGEGGSHPVVAAAEPAASRTDFGVYSGISGRVHCPDMIDRVGNALQADPRCQPYAP